MKSIRFKLFKIPNFRMPFKTEIKQFNTLTKRFQRDSAKIVNEIKVRVQEGGLNKTELQKLIESFGMFRLIFSL